MKSLLSAALALQTWNKDIPQRHCIPLNEDASTLIQVYCFCSHEVFECRMRGISETTKRLLWTMRLSGDVLCPTRLHAVFPPHARVGAFTFITLPTVSRVFEHSWLYRHAYHRYQVISQATVFSFSLSLIAKPNNTWDAPRVIGHCLNQKRSWVTIK